MWSVPSYKTSKLPCYIEMILLDKCVSYFTTIESDIGRYKIQCALFGSYVDQFNAFLSFGDSNMPLNILTLEN